MSVRRKLIIWMLLVLLAVFGAVGFVTVRAVRSELTARLDRSMKDGVRSAVAASQILTPEQSDAFDVPTESAWALVDDEGIHVAREEDGDRQVPAADLSRFSVDDLLDRAGEPFSVDALDGGAKVRVVTAQMDARRVLVMMRSTASIDETVTTVARAFFVVGGAAFVATVIAVAIVARAAMRPVEEMIDFAHDVGAGDLGRRAPAGAGATEVGRLANALNAMAGRLEEAFRDKERSEQQMREFLSDASHELRTPLTIVRAHAEMYRNPGFAPEDARAYAATIEAESVRMGRLVDDLLLLARLDKGQELERIEVDLAAVVTTSAHAAALLDTARTLAVDVPPHPVLVRGDEHRLRQAVDNLLANVRVHGGDAASVDVQLSVDGDEAVISVADDGPGVDAAELARLTDRFYRAERARHVGRPGSGLGLSIAAAVVAGHDGTIELASNGRGFRATLRLPRTGRGGASLDAVEQERA
jgi:two-component system OmpR family sensor kinase